MKMISSAHGSYSTPVGGKFFYAQLKFDGKFRSYVTLGLGAQSQDTNMMLNSEELTIGVFTKNCSSENQTA